MMGGDQNSKIREYFEGMTQANETVESLKKELKDAKDQIEKLMAQQVVKYTRIKSGGKYEKQHFYKLFEKIDAENEEGLSRQQTIEPTVPKIQTCIRSGCKNIAADEPRC